MTHALPSRWMNEYHPSMTCAPPPPVSALLLRRHLLLLLLPRRPSLNLLLKNPVSSLSLPHCPFLFPLFSLSPHHRLLLFFFYFFPFFPNFYFMFCTGLLTPIFSTSGLLSFVEQVYCEDTFEFRNRLQDFEAVPGSRSAFRRRRSLCVVSWESINLS